jgi:hypothetical protein
MGGSSCVLGRGPFAYEGFESLASGSHFTLVPPGLRAGWRQTGGIKEFQKNDQSWAPLEGRS